MNRNNIPLILMLVAGAVTCIITFIQDYPIWAKLLSLLIVLLVFFFLGSLLQWALDTFDIQNAQKAKEEGEVIEKGEEEQGEQEDKKEE
ncbi:MAG: hypothetical protein IJ801_05150 [Lachnospiraceae bacterium]|nr:hypothetical protein [Lachnospiraceae bacterium]